MVEQIDSHPTVRELYAATARRGGRPRRGGGRALAAEAVEDGCARRTSGCEASFGQDDPGEVARRGVPRDASRADRDARAARSGCARSPSSCCACPTGSPSTRSSPRQLERRRRRARRGRDRLGPRRVARVRLAARRGHPDPADRPGHRARDVLPPPPRAPRRTSRASIEMPMQELDERAGVVRGLQLAAVRVRVRRLRVRLLGRRARGARALGGAVRRLRERRADDHRPVHLERAREVEADLTPDAAAPARRTRATGRSTRARGSSASCSSTAQENIRIANCTTAAQYFHLLRRQALDPSRAAARRDDAEGAAAPEGRRLDARRARGRARSSRSSTRDVPDKAAIRRLVLCTGKVYYDIVGHEAAAGREHGRRRAASSSSTRSRSRPRAS